MTPIIDKISYIKATENPLSADVGVIYGEDYVYLFDVGNSDVTLEAIDGLEKEKKVILSHFHPDHIGNLDRGQWQEIFLGKNTFGYTHRGTVVEQDIYLEDGVKLHIFPLPSSHAKGSIGLEVNGKYAFLGDATYATQKAGKVVYNAGILAEEIRVLEKLDAKYFMLSHREPFVQEKEVVLSELKAIYARRKQGEPYIEV